MRRTEIIKSIREALSSIPYKMEARLYGSEARGDARPDSDIDLLILVDQPTVTGKDEETIFAPLYQIELQSGVIINPLIIPKSQWGVKVSPFYINVENEGVPLELATKAIEFDNPLGSFKKSVRAYHEYRKERRIKNDV